MMLFNITFNRMSCDYDLTNEVLYKTMSLIVSVKMMVKRFFRMLQARLSLDNPCRIKKEENEAEIG